MRRRQPISTGQSLLLGRRTIDFRCGRCGLLGESRPVNADGICPMPVGWTLHTTSSMAPHINLCRACTDEVAAGYPVDLRDLGRAG